MMVILTPIVLYNGGWNPREIVVCMPLSHWNPGYQCEMPIFSKLHRISSWFLLAICRHLHQHGEYNLLVRLYNLHCIIDILIIA